MDRDRLFGGSPLGVIIRLVVISVVVGIVLSALNLRPWELFSTLQLLASRVYALGFGAIEGLIGYFLVGAVVVIPIWALIRILSGLGRKDGSRQP